MKARELLTFLTRIEPLKTNTRHCYTAGGTHEVVAAHSWRLATMAMLISDEFPELDMDRVIRMCLVHDIGEAVTGDIPSFSKTAADVSVEDDAVVGLLSALPEPERGKLMALFAEMDAQKTAEARMYKTLDKLEAVIQHNESDIATWTPREYELNLTYGEDYAAAFPFLKQLRAEMRKDTEEKIAAAGKP